MSFEYLLYTARSERDACNKAIKEADQSGIDKADQGYLKKIQKWEKLNSLAKFFYYILDLQSSLEYELTELDFTAAERLISLQESGKWNFFQLEIIGKIKKYVQTINNLRNTFQEKMFHEKILQYDTFVTFVYDNNFEFSNVPGGVAEDQNGRKLTINETNQGLNCRRIRFVSHGLQNDFKSQIHESKAANKLIKSILRADSEAKTVKKRTIFSRKKSSAPDKLDRLFSQLEGYVLVMERVVKCCEEDDYRFSKFLDTIYTDTDNYVKSIVRAFVVADKDK